MHSGLSRPRGLQLNALNVWGSLELINTHHSNMIAVMGSDYYVLENNTLKHAFPNVIHLLCLKSYESSEVGSSNSEMYF